MSVMYMRDVAVTDEHVMHKMRRPTRTARGLTCDPLGERVEYGMVMSASEAEASFDDATHCPICYPPATSWSVAVGLPVVVTRDPFGTVTVEVDLSDLGSAIGGDDADLIECNGADGWDVPFAPDDEDAVYRDWNQNVAPALERADMTGTSRFKIEGE